MPQKSPDQDYYRRRAEAEIAIAKAAGAQKAEASADFKTVFIRKRDGQTEKVRIVPPNEMH
jgi:hypothetical protein